VEPGKAFWDGGSFRAVTPPREGVILKTKKEEEALIFEYLWHSLHPCISHSSPEKQNK
jgi:hypothetical protein